jgi:hypothetical protein
METLDMYREEYCFLNYEFSINSPWKLIVAYDHIFLIFSLFSAGNLSMSVTSVEKNMALTKTVDTHSYYKLMKILIITYI